ncbi:hypothetical protein Nmel_006266, partial [Mimus melanotis]
MWHALWPEPEDLVKRVHLPCPGSSSSSESLRPLKVLTDTDVTAALQHLLVGNPLSSFIKSTRGMKPLSNAYHIWEDWPCQAVTEWMALLQSRNLPQNLLQYLALVPLAIAIKVCFY